MKLVLQFFITFIITIGIVSEAYFELSSFEKVELSESDLEEKEVKQSKFFSNQISNHTKFLDIFEQKVKKKHYHKSNSLYTLLLQKGIDFPPEV